MKARIGDARIPRRRVVGGMLISLGCGVTSLAIWFVALLTAQAGRHAFELVLRQAIWLLPLLFILVYPIVLGLSSKKISSPPERTNSV